MASEMAEAIRQLISEKGIPEDLIVKTLEDSLLAAYKKKFGTSENAVIRFKENYEGIEIYAKKTIVADDDFEDEVLEIPLEEARKLAEEAEIGDILEIPIDPSEFDFQSVMLAKQTARQSLRDISRDTLYAEFKTKVGGNCYRLLPKREKWDDIRRFGKGGRGFPSQIPVTPRDIPHRRSY